MARYSRRTGPALDFPIPMFPEPIPDLEITRLFDDGQLLCAYSAVCQNTSGAARILEIGIALDGYPAGPGYVKHTVPTGTMMTFAAAVLISITAGIHTLTLYADGPGGIDQIVNTGTAQLSIIQLPLWDSDLNIT